jgi:hypothetical protein
MRLAIAILVTVLLVVGRVARAGDAFQTDLAVDVSADPSSGLHPGDRITFHLGVENLGPGVANGLTVSSSAIVDELDVFGISTSDCNGDVGVGVADLGNSFYYVIRWHPGPLGGDIAPGDILTCAISIDYTASAPASFPVTFQFSSTVSDLNPVNNAATVVLEAAALPPSAVPATDRLGTILLSAGLAAISILRLRRRARTQVLLRC